MEKLKIFLPRMVHGDWPIGHHLKAGPGEYEAVRNKYGAVAVVLPNGELLGVKPDEFYYFGVDVAEEVK